ncbi:N-acetylmuramoyl-L-alanine amidase family protein [Marininema halotolerans]|uniref:N-acetylmuramoyl-L-alanine amidase n=1 Tax=Marininema halotolerans TaxID=1155944 RepID=A0A1I6SVV0_9BACL|nr:N-acetylmuramoyl-L-alanine amidase [Marininema halotolerans]SFS80978.1 N-acetylmuramoyl-L-alanine amidase [Marininema halotolerans]
MERRICIDPGHGGADTGVIAFGLEEKEICLDIACRVREYLSMQGVEGRLTRSEDVALTWLERARRAEEFEAEVMISLHLSGSSDHQDSGFESYIGGCAGLTERSLQSWLHNHIAAFFRPFGIWDRGKKYDSTGAFPLLDEAVCPVIQLQLFFLTHPEEKRWCRHRPFREALAYAIAEGAIALLQQKSVK